MPTCITYRPSAARTLLLSLLIAGAWGRAVAQSPQDIRIGGSVQDTATGRPLENVNVFLAQTTIGTVTRANGRYQLEHVPAGAYELVFSRLGYVITHRHIEVDRPGAYTVDVRLHSRLIPVDEVEVAGSRAEWQKRLERFQREFLGESRNAEGCSLKNPEVLSFKMDSAAGILTAAADQPLIVENRALGYRLLVALREFQWNVRGNFGFFLVFSRFEPLAPSTAAQAARWSENRAATYGGSLRHFLAALVRRKLDQEQFRLFAGSLEDLEAHLGKSVPPGQLVLTPVPGTPFTRWVCDGWLRVDQDLPRGALTSFLRLDHTEADIDSAGSLRDPLSVGVQGYWQGFRLADLLPIDYTPRPGDK